MKKLLNKSMICGGAHPLAMAAAGCGVGMGQVYFFDSNAGPREYARGCAFGALSSTNQAFGVVRSITQEPIKAIVLTGLYTGTCRYSAYQMIPQSPGQLPSGPAIDYMNSVGSEE